MDNTSTRINDIEVNVGEDISSKINYFAREQQWDSHPQKIYKIYKDVEKTQLMDASLIKYYDGSFTDIYTVCSDGYTDLVSANYFDYEYTNSGSDTLTINGNHISGTYKDYSFVSENLSCLYPHRIDVSNITIYHNDEIISYIENNIEITFTPSRIIDDNGLKIEKDITQITVWVHKIFESYFIDNNIEYNNFELMYSTNNTRCLFFNE